MKKTTALKTAPTDLEEEARKNGYTVIGGIDEAGRGPLAGPVCAAVAVFDPGVIIPGVNDSKQVDEARREELYEQIVEKAAGYGIGTACAEEIDSLNILRATKLAVSRALQQIKILPDYLLLDALKLERCTIPQLAVVKGDSRSFSIAAASILAKVTRDRLMARYKEEFPMYRFEKHKGYGTADHRSAIQEHGPSTIHRETFLTAWFDTRPPITSHSFKEILSQINSSTDSDLTHIFQQITNKRDFLPKTEIRLLIQATENPQKKFSPSAI